MELWNKLVSHRALINVKMAFFKCMVWPKFSGNFTLVRNESAKWWVCSDAKLTSSGCNDWYPSVQTDWFINKMTTDYCHQRAVLESRTEKEKIQTWRIWEIQGSGQQHHDVHEKGKRKLDRRTLWWDWRKSEEEQQPEGIPTGERPDYCVTMESY